MVCLKSVGIMLKLKRVELGLTLEQVAKQVGVTANYISLIERGKNTPNAEIIDKLSELYSIDRDELYEHYGKIPATVAEQIEQSETLKKAISRIGKDERLTDEDRENLYERLLYWHQKAIEEKE